jgi:hypothetical protein
MRRLSVLLLFASILLVAMFSLIQVARGQDGVEPTRVQQPTGETQGDSRREVLAPDGLDGGVPLIGFIDSPTVSCYQPDPAQDTCYINWYYMSVSADPNYMITMTATINAIGTVARYHGFFQTGMYVPFSMNGQGFRVSCGELGSGGHPQLGNAYPWTIRARDSANLKSANYGTVYCPAFIP